MATEPTFHGMLTCHDCGRVLAEAVHVPESKQGLVAAQSCLVARPCPNGCRSTCSDLNLNTDLTWTKEQGDGEEEK